MRNRRRKIRRRRRIFISCFILIGIGLIASGFLINKFPDKPKEQPTQAKSQLTLKKLKSQNVILTDVKTGKALASQNPAEQIYPASLTKIMTALVALEHISDWEQTVTLPEHIFQELYNQNASMAGFQPGESTTYKALIYGILLPSGAECCLAAADHLAGSESAFVDLMNEKAHDLKMNNTHFVNATGLHDSDHYSTVEDISILLRYALENAHFREAFGSASYSVPTTDQHPEGFTFTSTFFKNLDDSDLEQGQILGGKTGYTPEAGLCLASLATIDGQEYILVTTGADGSPSSKPYHILDAVSAYSQLGAIIH